MALSNGGVFFFYTADGIGHTEISEPLLNFPLRVISPYAHYIYRIYIAEPEYIDKLPLLALKTLT